MYYTFRNDGGFIDFNLKSSRSCTVANIIELNIQDEIGNRLKLKPNRDRQKLQIT